MAKKKKPKESWRRHSEDRMWLRYNRELTEGDHAAIVQLIQQGRGIHVATQSEANRVFDVPYMGLMLRVVYNRSRKQLVRILTPDMRVRNILIEIACEGCGRIAKLRPSRLAVCDGYFCGFCDFDPPESAEIVDVAAGALNGYRVNKR